jgi:hypothetical protein
MRYYHLTHGLRGCYMPDGEPYVIAVKTRRELKSAIESEADMLGDMVGLSKKAIASFVAECWRRYYDKSWSLNMVLPCHDRSVKIATYSYGIFLSRATRRDYLDQGADQ